MSIFVIGINHKTAAVTLREKIYFAIEKLPLYLQDLLGQGKTQEAVLLSTCNRSELYCEAEEVGQIRDWFCAQTASSPNDLTSALYIYRDVEAVTHIMNVACGLDSMILGEPQILGQMKEAFSESCTAGAVGALFHRLFQQVFMLAKEIRTTTAIGACPVSVASAAVHFAKQKVVDFTNAQVVLLGAGDTTQLLLRYLCSQLKKPVILVNRSIDKAAELIQEVGGSVYGMEDLTHALSKADIVFSATGSPVPLVTKEIVANAMSTRTSKAMTFIDLAVPRDIEFHITEVANVHLHCIDDLKTIIETNRQGREHAADKAREMIRKKSQHFMLELTSYDKVVHTIRAYRGQIEAICRAELIKAKQQLYQGIDASVVLDAFAHAFTKKLLHVPSVKLRQAGALGQTELLHFAKQLFAIPDHEVEHL